MSYGTRSRFLSLLLLNCVLVSCSPSPQTNSEPLKGKDKQQESRQPNILSIEQISGRDMLVALVSNRDGQNYASGTSSSSGGYSSSSGREFQMSNIIFLDRRTGVNKPLLPDNDRVIQGFGILPSGNRHLRNRVSGVDASGAIANVDPKAEFLYVKISDPVIKGKSATFSLLMYDIDTSRQVLVLSGIENVHYLEVLPDRSIGLISERQGATSHHRIDPDSFAILSTTAIAVGR